MGSADLASSKHNPCFPDRTLSTRLEIEDLLAGFRRKVNKIITDKDEDALNELHSNLKRADEALDDRMLTAIDPDSSESAMSDMGQDMDDLMQDAEKTQMGNAAVMELLRQNEKPMRQIQHEWQS